MAHTPATRATILRTVALAVRHGVAIGAHPGYPDLAGFGRRDLRPDPGRAAGVARRPGRGRDRGSPGRRASGPSREAARRHVQPGGARRRRWPTTIATAIRDLDPALVLVGLAGSASIAAGRAAGLRVGRGGASRIAATSRMARSAPAGSTGALLGPPEAAAQAVVDRPRRPRHRGRRIAVAVRADTICVHGDSPDAVEIARAVRAALESAGIGIAALRDG